MEIGLVLLWLLCYLAFFLAGLPVAAALTPYVEDRGASVALPLALAVVTLAVFWVGHLSYGVAAIAVGVAAMLAATVAAGNYVDLDALDWRLVAETFAVFAVAFLFMVGIRSLDPGIVPGGGEKFLDYGLMRSIMRSSYLPPGDFWFAGERMRYYYSGHLLSAALTTLTATPPQYGYNLALAGFYGMLVTAAYGLSGSVGVASGTSRRTAAALGAFFVGFASNLYAAGWLLLNALPRGVVERLAVLYGVPPADVSSEVDTVVGPFSYWDASRVIPDTINEFPLFAWLNGDLHGHMMNMPFILLAATLAFGYYRTPAEDRGRRLGLLAVLGVVIGLIASVSTWSFPVALGVAWLAVAFADADPLSLFGLPPADREETRYFVRELRWSGGALVVTALLAAVAVVTVLPFWFAAVGDRSLGFLPERSGVVALLVVHGAFLLVFGPSLVRRLRPSLDYPVLVTVVGFGVVVATWLAGPLGFVLAAAFGIAARTIAVSFDTGRFTGELLAVQAGVAYVLFVAVTLLVESQSAGYGPPDRVDALALGSVAVLVAALLAVAFGDDRRSVGALVRAGSLLLALAAAVAVRAVVVPFVREWYVADTPCSAVTGSVAQEHCEFARAVVDPASVAFVLPVVVVGWALLRRRRSATPHTGSRRTVSRGTAAAASNEREPWHARDFGVVLMLAGAGLVVLCEFVYVTNAGIGGRFNTVFKLYAQAWVLWGPAAGVTLARLLEARRPTAVTTPLASARRAAVDLPVPGPAQLFVAAIVFTTAVYGAFAVAEHVEFYQAGYCVHPDDPTLDGLAYVHDCHPAEAEAIRWLDERPGRPVVAARPTQATYQWGSPAASLTGLPTVAGWSHEAQYRGWETWNERATEADAIFAANASVRVRLLKKYDVRYIYWGPQERAEPSYSNETFRWLTGVEAQQHGNVTVYVVDQSELGVREGYDQSAVEENGGSLSERVASSFREEFCTRPPDERPSWATGLCRGSANGSANGSLEGG